jgi:hypothetical protein
MKTFLSIIAIVAIIGACNERMSVTAHPDNQTFTSGTAGSAKMTTEMPRKPQNVVVRPDTSKIRMDSVRRN